MADFTSFTTQNAPSESRQVLAQIEQKLGFIPSILGMMAASPALIQGLASLREVYEKTSLTPIERRVVLLVTSVENKSDVCIAAHSMELRQTLKADDAIIEAARNGGKFPDERMNNLAEFVREITRNKGQLSDSSRENFFRAGFSQENALDVILGVTIETLTSYTSHLVQAPVDQQLLSEAPKKAA